MDFQKEKNRYAELLTKKVNKHPCPMCGNQHFSLVDGFLSNSVHSDLNVVNLGGAAIPTVSIICTNCGFISQHALGIIDPDALDTSDKQ